MPRSNRWKEYPLPPNWDERYDPSTKLNEPHGRIHGLGIMTMISEGNRSVKLSHASRTNSIVNKFLAKSYEPKHDQLQRRRKSSSTSRKSNARRVRRCNMELHSCSSPLSPAVNSAHVSCQPRHHSSHLVAIANPGSIKDDAALGEVVVGERVPKHEVVKQSTPVPEARELCLAPLHVESAPAQDDARGTRGLKTFHSKADGNPKRICEVFEHCRLSKPNKAVILSSLLIWAKGPDQSLLCRRIPARGPDLSLGRGPNPSLVRGPNPALLRKNQPQALSSAP
ncbi:conserved hypothetical protein [Echinococcus multilocularis]|uniref:Uncharacterized protein n=1 Tax=Echinococcus multilocularis TaxID=6211 RepID=A0A068YCS7_ECHMU|nr:conserved hypothetical protein [Echinococcus multilocularis]